MDKFNVEKEILDTSELERLFLQEGILATIKRNGYLIRQNEMTNQQGLLYLVFSVYQEQTLMAMSG